MSYGMYRPNPYMMMPFRIPNDIEYKQKAKAIKVVKAGAKGKARSFKNFDAQWSTDMKEIDVYKNQNITKVKTLHSVGRMHGRSGSTKELGKGLAAVMKASMMKKLNPSKKHKPRKSSGDFDIKW